MSDTTKMIDNSVAAYMAKIIVGIGEQANKESQLDKIANDPDELLTHRLAARMLYFNWDSTIAWAEEALDRTLKTLKSRN